MLKRLGAFFLDIAEIIVFAIGFFFFLYLTVMRPHKIKGASMMPNYPDAEYILTERISAFTNNLKRGDVVVFQPPVSEDEYIKRIIGLPGDLVAIRGGKIYVNGSLLNEKYLDPNSITEGNTYLAEGAEVTIPAGQYLVIGDNRPHSYDSRSWGPITKSKITGKAWLVYWPIKNLGIVDRPNY